MRKFGTAVILAGGKSTRMGYDKQNLVVDGSSLIDNLAFRLNEYFDDIVIVSNTLEEADKGIYRTVNDEIKNMGPLGGIHAGLKAASSLYVFFIACDMPNFNPCYMKYLKNNIEDELAAVTMKNDWIEPFHAFYSKTLIKNIEELLRTGRANIYKLLKTVNTKYIEEKIAREFTPDWKLFYNINTIEDLEKLDKHPN